jgi:hypothetical protein
MSEHKYRRRQERQSEAAERQREYATLSNADKLARLKARGHGNCTEAVRLRGALKD